MLGQPSQDHDLGLDRQLEFGLGRLLDGLAALVDECTV